MGWLGLWVWDTAFSCRGEDTSALRRGPFSMPADVLARARVRLLVAIACLLLLACSGGGGPAPCGAGRRAAAAGAAGQAQAKVPQTIADGGTQSDCPQALERALTALEAFRPPARVLEAIDEGLAGEGAILGKPSVDAGNVAVGVAPKIVSLDGWP